MTNHLFAALRAGLSATRRPFITSPERDDATFSAAEALDWSGRLANLLRLWGVQPGDRVAVQVEKSAEVILLYFACVRAGAVYLPLNTAYPLAELDYFIGDAEPRLVVCMPERLAGIGPLALAKGAARVETLGRLGDGTLWRAAAEQPAAFEDAARGADDLAAILYTSGTTGRPKGAMLTHGNLASNAQLLAREWRITADDVLLHALPVYHAHGLFVAMNSVTVAGASTLLLSHLDTGQLLRLMPQATMMMGVPTFYVRLLADPGLTAEAVRSMRLFISGSAPLLAETHEAWNARTGHRILERYGLTETLMNTSNPYDGDRVAGTVGPALPGIEVRVVDAETGAPLPQGDIGMVEVRGANVFKGYWRMPDKTAAEFRADGFFITGDLGKLDERGYLHIVGRGKDLVISGGLNVYPKEVELEIDALPGVGESAVIGLPHADFGEAVTAVVVPRGNAGLDEATVIGALRERLAKFKQPKRVVFVTELPRNAMGKVQKNVLREQYRDLYVSGV